MNDSVLDVESKEQITDTGCFNYLVPSCNSENTSTSEIPHTNTMQPSRCNSENTSTSEISHTTLNTMQLSTCDSENTSTSEIPNTIPNTMQPSTCNSENTSTSEIFHTTPNTMQPSTSDSENTSTSEMPHTIPNTKQPSTCNSENTSTSEIPHTNTMQPSRCNSENTSTSEISHTTLNTMQLSTYDSENTSTSEIPDTIPNTMQPSTCNSENTSTSEIFHTTPNTMQPSTSDSENTSTSEMPHTIPNTMQPSTCNSENTSTSEIPHTTLNTIQLSTCNLENLSTYERPHITPNTIKLSTCNSEIPHTTPNTTQLSTCNSENMSTSEILHTTSNTIQPSTCNSENMSTSEIPHITLNTIQPRTCNSENMPTSEKPHTTHNTKQPSTCNSENMSTSEISHTTPNTIQPSTCKSEASAAVWNFDVEENHNMESQEIRKGMCELCQIAPSKYKCPACELKTCSLSCVKEHKLRLNCTGERLKAAFVDMAQYSERHLLNDYRFLEDAERKLYSNKMVPENRRQVIHGAPYYLNKRSKLLITAAIKRGVELQMVSCALSKNKTNTSFYTISTDTIGWHIEWHFVVSNTVVKDGKVSEHVILMEAAKKHTNFVQYPHLRKCLEDYKKEKLDECRFLLKLEGLPANRKRYFELKSKATLAENLKGHTIIEYPTILIVPQTAKDNEYQLLSKDDLVVMDPSMARHLASYHSEYNVQAAIEEMLLNPKSSLYTGSG